MNLLSETDKAYLAGFFDGEGCIYIAKGKTRPGGLAPDHALRVIFTQCDEEILEYWQGKVGLGAIHRQEHKNDKHRDGYSWVVSQRDAVKLLNGIYDYLMLKKDQADVAFKFQATYDGQERRRAYRVPKSIIKQREEYRKLLQKLKKRGLADSDESQERIEKIEKMHTQNQLSLF